MSDDEFAWKKSIVNLQHAKIEDAANELYELFDKYDWFYDIRTEKNRVIIVYVENMSKEVCDLVPDSIYGFQIKMAFSSYLTCKDKYGAKPMALGERSEDYEE